ncbi:hypothetical protein ACFQ3R_01040 [Mesonia ostreae]|uniref:Uncharacterized protein n=1 Tax=Mesonia ostreae TaxID=861110 RepID=A0ABU2KHS1_9FLAO|nr:hypothetical protein [Mesonia ostreae]MDT0294266.1 hypothetical protein [Mesonia ostreae]
MKDQEKEKNKPLYNSDVTEREKERLNTENVHDDNGDDEMLRDRKRKTDFEGKDLDIPGRNTAKKDHGPEGLKDEENGLYSQGGNNNDLEEDHSGVNDKN